MLLVTGDEAACSEGRELLGAGLTTVAVKQGLGVFSARMIPPVRARELIEDGAKRALSDPKAVAPYDPGTPCEIKVEYKNTAAPDRHASANPYRCKVVTKSAAQRKLVVTKTPMAHASASAPSRNAVPELVFKSSIMC